MIYYSLIYLFSIAVQELIDFNYDKEIMSKIIVRAYHSIICIYYLISILYSEEKPIIETNTSQLPEDVKYNLLRSSYFFIWDSIMLILTNEKNKTIYLQHNFINCFTITYSIYYEINWYFACACLFLTEVTNPITQISETFDLFAYYNVNFEKIYFLSMLTTRLILSISLILISTFNIFKLYYIDSNSSGVVNNSIIINYSTLIFITLEGINLLSDKFVKITIDNAIKKEN
jgi:hypothetical protein